LLLVCEDREKSAYHLNDLEQLLGQENVLFFPSSYRKPYQTETTDNANVLLRSEVLNKLSNSKKPRIIVTYPQALFEKVVSQATLRKNTLEVIKGSQLSLDFVNEVLFDYNFERVDFVSQPGEFSVRGGIIDVFSFANQHPYRIEFFDEEVESLRSFDVATQLSIASLDKIKLLPNTSEGFKRATRKSLIELIASNGVLIMQNLDGLASHLDHYYEDAEKNFNALSGETQHLPPTTLFLSKEDLINSLDGLSWVTLLPSVEKKTKESIFLKQSPQPAFNRKFDRLISYEGFEDIDAKVAVFTDHQIFERYHKYQLKSGYTKKQALTLKELTHLEVGDYVTHIDHGIGTFGGLQKIDVDGNMQEAIKLIYADRDILYLSIHSLHKISKFKVIFS